MKEGSVSLLDINLFPYFICHFISYMGQNGENKACKSSNGGAGRKVGKKVPI